MDDKSSRVTTAEIQWSRHIVLTTKTMDAGRRVKVNVCINRPDSSRTKGLLPNAVDIRASNADKRREKIMSVPLLDRCGKIIATKIIDTYPNLAQVDLKTAWLALRQLSASIQRDDEEAAQLFCGEDQALAELTFSCTYNRLERAVKKVLAREDMVPQRHWLLLRKLAIEATRRKLLHNNPLDSVWKPLLHADAHDIQRIQSALRDWALAPQQMDRMMLPLLSEVEQDGKSYRRYEVDSHALLQIFAALTLLHKNELAALNYGDIEPLPNGAAYVNITKYIDPSDGKIHYYADSQKRRILCRRSVLPELVTRCLAARKKYIKKRLKLSDSEMRTIPLFWEDEVDSKSKIRRIGLKTAGKLYASMIDAARGDQQEQQSNDAVSVNIDDVVKYLDVGISDNNEFVLINNLKVWTESVCGAVNGELAYNSGVEPVATIDRHYIAWYAVYNLVATSAVFGRFCARWLALIDPIRPRPAMGRIALEGDGAPLVWTPPADKQGTLRITIQGNVPMVVDVDTAYGHQTKMTCYDEHS